MILVHNLNAAMKRLVLGKDWGKRGKSPGEGAFFSCVDSVRWILCTMCRRHSPFPR